MSPMRGQVPYRSILSVTEHTRRSILSVTEHARQSYRAGVARAIREGDLEQRPRPSEARIKPTAKDAAVPPEADNPATSAENLIVNDPEATAVRAATPVPERATEFPRYS